MLRAGAKRSSESVSCDYDPICPLAGWVSDQSQALGVALKLVNTASEEWSWKRVKGKRPGRRDRRDLGSGNVS